MDIHWWGRGTGLHYHCRGRHRVGWQRCRSKGKSMSRKRSKSRGRGSRLAGVGAPIKAATNLSCLTTSATLTHQQSPLLGQSTSACPTDQQALTAPAHCEMGRPAMDGQADGARAMVGLAEGL